MRIALALTLLVGCPKPKTDPCEAGDAPTLELGTGEEDFQTIEDANHELTLVHGPQGGYHVVLRTRSTQLDSRLGQVTATFEGRINGNVKAGSEAWLQLDCKGGEQISEPVNLVWDGTPDTLHLQEAEIDVLLRDNSGTAIEDSFTALIVDPKF